jgi:Domain of unknown function (DUF4397)
MHRVSTLIAAGALAVGPLVAGGAMAADLFAVHGINGEDLGSAEDFPVDVNVVFPDGSEVCVLTDLLFGDAEGPVTVEDAGLYTIEIYPAANGDCTGTLLVSDQVSISAVDTALIVAQLDASNSPVIRKYNLNATELGDAEGRISAIHAAAAPAVDIEIVDETTFLNVQNGQQTFPLTLEDGPYRIFVRDPASGDRLASRRVTVAPGEIGVGIFVGSVANDTLEVLRLVVDTTLEPMSMEMERGEEPVQP